MKNPFRSRIRQNGSDRETDRASGRCPRAAMLYASTTDQFDQDHDDSDDQQNMDEAAYGVGGDQAKHPQDQENNCDGIEHDGVLVSFDSDKFVVM
jgi:hypothetical protein